jgi:hypothetical protein
MGMNLFKQEDKTMPYISIRTCYPPTKINETVNVFLDVQKKYPPDEELMKTLVPSAVSGTLDGVEALSVYEVERYKVGDALLRISKVMAEYRKIEGYFYEIKTWLTAEEAISTIT